ncbi:hypothetical protein V502_04395 [Pseudogymnoascus sp. VKM F-4520 (FW-2644)]|nr:hypothetical protein V502_04395 [Pseudogymnoascus sp. VKM F-4520 (FW-2644)]
MDQQPTVRIRSPVILESLESLIAQTVIHLYGATFVVLTMVTMVLAMVPLIRTAALWQSKVTPLPTISPISPIGYGSGMPCVEGSVVGAEVGTGEAGDTGNTPDCTLCHVRVSISHVLTSQLSHVLKSDKSWRHSELSLESTAPHQPIYHPINRLESNQPTAKQRTPTCSNHTTPLDPSWKSRMQGTPRSDSPTRSSYSQQTLVLDSCFRTITCF